MGVHDCGRPSAVFLPPRRELLCDRKDPYLHLTPRRLAFTVVKSGFVVAAPMINQVILENLDEVTAVVYVLYRVCA